MPEISRFLGIVILLYLNEHNPPHFHALYGKQEGVFSIDPLQLIEGKLPPRIHGFVIEWASMHQKQIMENWNALRQGKPVKKIKPLV